MIRRVCQCLSLGNLSRGTEELRKQLQVRDEQGQGAFSLFRLERLGQEGRALGNGGLPFRDRSLGEDDWLTSHDEEEQHGVQCRVRELIHPRSIPCRKRQQVRSVCSRKKWALFSTYRSQVPMVAPGTQDGVQNKWRGHSVS